MSDFKHPEEFQGLWGDSFDDVHVAEAIESEMQMAGVRKQIPVMEKNVRFVDGRRKAPGGESAIVREGPFECTQRLRNFGPAGCAYGSKTEGGMCSHHEKAYDKIWVSLKAGACGKDKKVRDMLRAINFIPKDEIESEMDHLVEENKRQAAELVKLRQMAATVSVPSAEELRKRREKEALSKKREEDVLRKRREEDALSKKREEELNEKSRVVAEREHANEARFAKMEAGLKNLATGQKELKKEVRENLDISLSANAATAAELARAKESVVKEFDYMHKKVDKIEDVVVACGQQINISGDTDDMMHRIEKRRAERAAAAAAQKGVGFDARSVFANWDK